MKKRKSKKSSKSKKNSFINGLILRYLLIIIVALPSLWIFYLIFTPLTAYPVYWLTKIFFEAVLVNNTIIINKTIPIELIKACIAGSAYYLLFILNMSIPNIKIQKRVRMIVSAFLTLLVLNILRIFFLTFIYMRGYSFFDAAHQLFWYAISTVFVVGIWFGEVKIYKIKEIPVYSDVKFLYEKFIKSR